MNRYLVAVVAAVLVASPPVVAAPAPTPPPDDGGASVQTLEPSRPSTPALDDAFLSDLTRRRDTYCRRPYGHFRRARHLRLSRCGTRCNRGRGYRDA